MNTHLDNSTDIIDSRDVIARIEELESEQKAYLEDISNLDDTMDALCANLGGYKDEAGEGHYGANLSAGDLLAAEINDLAVRAERVREALETWEQDGGEELDTLRALAAQGEHAADWEHGEALIRYSHFKYYAQELAEDTGMISGTEDWPLRCIDWDQAARELEQDYSEVDFDGVTYYIR